jgi:hypothetical protein
LVDVGEVQTLLDSEHGLLGMVIEFAF